MLDLQFVNDQALTMVNNIAGTQGLGANKILLRAP